MIKYYVFELGDHAYNIIIGRKLCNVVACNEKQYYAFMDKKVGLDMYKNDVDPEKCPVVTLKPNIFYALASKLGLVLKEKYDMLNNDFSHIIYLKNSAQEKLLIDQLNNEYVCDTVISNSNESDYILLPDHVYEYLKESVIENDFNFVGMKKEHYISKDYILNNFEDMVKAGNYNKDVLIERYDYFDIELIKDKFKKYHSNEISKAYFVNFCNLMSNLLKYYPLYMEKENRNIFKIVREHLEDVYLDIEEYNDSKLSECFACIKFLHMILRNGLKMPKNKNTRIYYNLNWYNYSNDMYIYEISIVDYQNKAYWMGFVVNPIFDFDKEYIARYYYKEVQLNTLSYSLCQCYDYDGDDEDIYNEYDIFSTQYVPKDYNKPFVFDETLRTTYFK